jgi:hypothetical protein
VTVEQEEQFQALCGCFELGDLSEPEFSRAARQLGVDEHEIGEFIQWVRGDE